MKFLICRHCGNLIGLINDEGIPIICCADLMTELVPNSVEASEEKHLPVVTAAGNTVAVQVGSAPHPMLDEHHIEFIYVETECGGQRKGLKIGKDPAASFCFTDDKPVAVYAYCNLHGLWKMEV